MGIDVGANDGDAVGVAVGRTVGLDVVGPSEVGKLVGVYVG